MPHASLKIVDGVNQNRTPTLNEAGLSQSQLIRYMPNNRGDAILVQKIGGWQKFYASTTAAIVRALWAWQDTIANARLAFGTQNASGSFQAQLAAILNGSLKDITPRSQTDNITAVVSSTINSSIVTITDTTIQNITGYDTVYIPTHISIGGVVIFGLYPCNPDGHLAGTTYTVQTHDILGNPVLATASSTTPTLPLFAVTSGSSAVTVTLNNHGYVVGDTYPVLIPTTVGGVTFNGQYPVLTVVDANNFTITGPQQASATTTGYLNNNKARYIYSFAAGSIPGGTGYGIGGYGRGGYGSGTAVTPSTGNPISADDWTLDNWGEILLACPSETPILLTTTATSGNGTTGTITFSGQSYTTPTGTGVVVSGVSPSSWNGTYLATASSTHSVSFATAVTASMVTAGTVLIQTTPFSPIYQWSPESGAPFASIIPQAPPVNEGMFLAMPQRQIIAYGSTFTGIQDPLLIRWCDVNDFSAWVGMVTNQAGSFRLPRGSKIVGGMQGPQQGIIWTDVGVWSMQYISQPYVYSFNEVGTGCGLIAKKAAASLNNNMYWMGYSQFYSLSDDGVQVIPCDVWDVVFQNLDMANTDKIRVAVNSRFGEIMWYYPSQSGGTGEIDSYIKMTLVLGRITWDYGTLARSAWIDQSVLGPPIGTDPNTLAIYQHETSPDADGQPLNASFRTGYFAISDGDYKSFLNEVWPDFKYGEYGGTMGAQINMTFYAADFPEQTPTAYGPYTMTQSTTYFTPRIRTRLLAIEVGSSDVGSFWRIGDIRYRYAPDGRY